MQRNIDEKKVVGVKQTIKLIKSGNTKKVFVAKDAEIRVITPLISLCKDNNIDICYIESMKELGNLCGIDVNAACAAIIKD